MVGTGRNPFTPHTPSCPAIAVQRTASLPLAYVPGIHVLLLFRAKTWMAGTRPAMTRNDHVLLSTIQLLVMAEDAVRVEGNPPLACKIEPDIGTGGDAIAQFD